MMRRKRALWKGTAPVLQAVQLPPYVRTSAYTFMLLMLLSLLATLLLPWQQTATATGRVLAYSPQDRDQYIEAPIKGRITKWHVSEGERVQKGQLLAEITDNDPTYTARLGEQREATRNKRDAYQKGVQALEEQVTSLGNQRKLEVAAMDAKIRMSNHEVNAAQQTLSAARGKLEAAKLNFTRKKELSSKGLESQRSFELARAKKIEADAKVSESKAKLAGKRSKVLSLKAEREGKALSMDAKIQEVRSKLESTRAKLADAQASLSKAEVKLSRQSQQKIHAPRDGVILEINAREDTEFVKAGDALATLIPETSSRAVELWISGMDAPLVWSGRRVRLQFEGWPAVQFSGWPSVAVGTFAGVVDFVDARANTEGKFRVVVLPDPEEQLWPRSQILRQGARANGWVLLDEVPLWYEFWRQLNGFPPSVSQEALYGTNRKKGAKKKK